MGALAESTTPKLTLLQDEACFSLYLLVQSIPSIPLLPSVSLAAETEISGAGPTLEGKMIGNGQKGC